MIINFLVGNQVFSIKVDPDRTLSMKGQMTNGKFLTFKELILKTGQEGRAEEMTQRIVSCQHCLPSDDDVEFYVKDEILRTPELMKLGVRYVNTVR